MYICIWNIAKRSTCGVLSTCRRGPRRTRLLRALEIPPCIHTVKMGNEQHSLPIYDAKHGPSEEMPQTFLRRLDRQQRLSRHWQVLKRLLFVFILVGLGILGIQVLFPHEHYQRFARIPPNAASIRARCENLKLKPGPHPLFNNRSSSDRFVPGTEPVLIRNATIWTGRIQGLEIIKGDLLLENGLIKALGHIDASRFQYLDRLTSIDAMGSWVTPG